MKVVKFGGTSLANAEQIKKVCDIVLADKKRKVIVVSAPGKRSSDDTKVTDLLILLANKVIDGEEYALEIRHVLERFIEIACDLGIDGHVTDKIELDLQKRTQKYPCDKLKFMDLIKAAGEDFSAQIVAEYINKCGYTAHYINPKDAGLILSGEFGNARVLPNSYETLKKLSDIEGILVFPGFFGYTKDGEVVTFSRGGSDITGSILAAALDAEVYENFTDVDFVFAANPKVIKNPKPIEEITYREMRELSYAGFTVLHEETIEPVHQKGIPVNIRNTNNPSAPGTMILKTRKNTEHPVVGIACDGGFCSLYISKYLMNREIGFGRKVLQILEENDISFEHMPSGIDNMSIIIREKFLTQEKEDRIINRIKTELRADEVYIEHGHAMLMVVGEGMLKSVGVASRATHALSKANVNIEMINQGSSEVSVMFGILEKDSETALRSLYDEYFNT